MRVTSPTVVKGVVNENTPEARALQQCWVQLTQGIQDPEIVADHLFAMKFISQATLQEVGNATLSMPKKNRKLLQNMYRHITFNPNKFWDFVEILKKEEYSVYLASALEIAYSKLMCLCGLVFCQGWVPEPFVRGLTIWYSK